MQIKTVSSITSLHSATVCDLECIFTDLLAALCSSRCIIVHQMAHVFKAYNSLSAFWFMIKHHTRTSLPWISPSPPLVIFLSNCSQQRVADHMLICR